MKYSEVYKLMKQAYVRELVKKAAFETSQVNSNKTGNSIKRGPYYSYFGLRPQVYKQDFTQQEQPYTGGGTAALTPKSKVINTNDMNDIQRPAKTYNALFPNFRDRLTGSQAWKYFFSNQVNPIPRGGETFGTTEPKGDVNASVSGTVETPISLPSGYGWHAYKPTR